MEDIRLIVTLSEDGKVNVNGPLTDKILCYGLLEAAKDAVKNFSLEKSNIVRPIVMPNIKGQS